MGRKGHRPAGTQSPSIAVHPYLRMRVRLRLLPAVQTLDDP